MNDAQKLEQIRREMEAAGVDAYLLPHADEYQNEFLPCYAKRLAWLTGFTGSAGYAAILNDSAAVFVDGRYTIQVQSEVDAKLYAYEDYTKVMPWFWIGLHMQKGQVVGYDPACWTVQQKDQIERHFSGCGLVLRACENFVDKIWDDQPAAPIWPPFLYDEDLAGQGVKAKIADISERLSGWADYLLLTQLDSIAWLTNLRGKDVACSPFFLATAIVDLNKEAVYLFLSKEKIAAMEELPSTHEHIHVHDIDGLDDFLSSSCSAKAVRMDPRYSSAFHHSRCEAAGCVVKQGDCPVIALKALKNEVEQKHIRHAHCKDGAAIASFLCWFDKHKSSGELDELSAESYLTEQRRRQHGFFDISFDPISGFAGNGAIVHYRATESTNKKIEGDGLYLIDSGGQYYDGTTDLTRTVAVGTPSEQMKKHYTLVLKGHIAMARAVFPSGTTGAQIDHLAREPLWKEGLDYAHGTGHGVGMFLNVHEGPASLSPRSNYPLQAGMLLSNEPGYYKTDAYGIRIENLVFVKEAGFAFEDGRSALCFETVSYVPFDRTLIVKDLLCEEEVVWLDNYHADVWRSVSPFVAADRDVYDWLYDCTRPLS